MDEENKFKVGDLVKLATPHHPSARRTLPKGKLGVVVKVERTYINILNVDADERFYVHNEDLERIDNDS